MSRTAIENALRYRAILVSRAFKELFNIDDARAQARWRRLLMADEATVRRVGEHCLADLRDFCWATRSSFDPDPLIMARRAGRRDVWLRITNYLNLDEAQVQKLMEIDDGIE